MREEVKMNRTKNTGTLLLHGRSARPARKIKKNVQEEGLNKRGKPTNQTPGAQCPKKGVEIGKRSHYGNQSAVFGARRE